MDYNMLANQSVNSTNAPAYNYPAWRTQATQAYIAGFQRAYETNRAPFFIGNHFEHWNGGIYMDAVEEAFKHIAREKEKGGTYAWSPSGSSSTGWTYRSRRCSPSCARSTSARQPAGGWKTFLAQRHLHAPTVHGLLERCLKCGFRSARGVRKIPGTGMRNFSHECRQPRPSRSTAPVAAPSCSPQVPRSPR